MRTKLLVLVAVAAFAVAGCRSAATKKTDSPEVARAEVTELSPAEARPAVEAAYSQFVDVRSPEEFAGGHAYRARNIPLDELPASLDKLEKNEPVYVICETGRRSQKAAEILRGAGFKQAISITGGTAAWREAGLPMAK
jgi:rhodanese-related sulfurtransferase